MLVFAVHWWPTPVSVGGSYIYSDLDKPTHTPVPCWMPKPLPPKNSYTGCFTPTNVYSCVDRHGGFFFLPNVCFILSKLRRWPEDFESKAANCFLDGARNTRKIIARWHIGWSSLDILMTYLCVERFECGMENRSPFRLGRMHVL